MYIYTRTPAHIRSVPGADPEGNHGGCDSQSSGCIIWLPKRKIILIAYGSPLNNYFLTWAYSWPLQKWSATDIQATQIYGDIHNLFLLYCHYKQYDSFSMFVVTSSSSFRLLINNVLKSRHHVWVRVNQGIKHRPPPRHRPPGTKVWCRCQPPYNPPRSPATWASLPRASV